MKLLILTQYFPPEVGAPQNRLFELAMYLKKFDVDITVLTAMPNYPQMKIYEGYEGKSYVYEEIQGIKVHRSAIFIPKNKSIISRLRNYFSFVYSSARVGKRKLEDKYDFILCESPPLFLGYSAMYLANLKDAKLIFNVSDLWPESAEKLGVVTNKALLNVAYNLEHKIYTRSALVCGQTQGICKNINKRFPSTKTFWLPNGADLNLYDPAVINSNGWRINNGFKETDFLFLYAGVIGIAQGLEVILNTAKLTQNNTNIKYILLGSGPEKVRLLEMATKLELTNVFFMEGVSKKEMKFILKDVNASLIPLRKLDLFLGAIPSKIFEAMAMKLPVILGVDGEARELFVNQGKCALYSEPDNHDMLAEQVLNLVAHKDLQIKLGEAGRSYTLENFNRQKIAESFYHQLKELV